MFEWVFLAVLLLVAAALAAVWVRLGGRSGGETALTEALERSRQTSEAAARDILERISRIDAEGREALSRRLGDFARELSERFEKLTQANTAQLSEIRQEVETKLSATLAKNQEHFGEVASRLAKLYEVAGQMSAVAPDIHKLATTLASPKGRGAFGELSLSAILRDLLPPEFYKEQYVLQGAERVDAAIFLKEGILPIDSKFTLPAGVDPSIEDGSPEAKEGARLFRLAVLERAKEISGKYVVPGKTLDFAFMYIPAESIYYRVVMERDLHASLLKQKVVPVSPNSLYAYLQAIAIGLRGMKLEANARQMQKLILQLKSDFDRFGKDFMTLGNHLDNARKKFAEAERDVSRFTERVAQLSLGGEGEPPAQILPPAGQEAAAG